jgi:perosamine synthetase
VLKIIPVAGPQISEREIQYVLDAVKNGWQQNANYYINKFEDTFKSYVGREYAMALPSCTSALHLSLLALGIKEGDEVIVPDITWIASAAPIKYVGATPVFADIDPIRWCICPKSVASLISKKTKAIIAVNLYGHMPAYDELEKFGIPIIEDAAESIGSIYKGKISGSFGNTSCFSFHGSKTMTTGEGGMLVTDDKNLYNRCQILRDHGRAPGDHYFQNNEVGYKYKLSNIQAALGLAQIEQINTFVEKKIEIFNWYTNELENFQDIQLNPLLEDTQNSYWMTTAHFSHNISKTKFDIMEELKKYNIISRPFFSPLSSLQAFREEPDKKRAEQENKNSYFISSRGINLPSALTLQHEDIVYVSRILKSLLTPTSSQ